MVATVRCLPALFLAFVALISVPAHGAAQEGADEPLLEQLRDRLKGRAFTLGVLVQFMGDFQSDRAFPGANGFGLGAVRIDIQGQLDRGWGYRVQTELGGILDAYVSYAAHHAARLEGGVFKTPFGGEFLLSTSDTDMIDRPQLVRGLAPGRKVGTQVRGAPGDGPVAYRFGVFNSGGSLVGSDDGTLLWVVRATYGTPTLRDGVTRTEGFRVGLNLARGQDRAIIGAGAAIRYTGIQDLIGADLRLERGPWLITTELVAGRSEGPDRMEPWGLEGTVGYRLGERSQVLARWDSFSAAVPETEGSNLLILGWNHWATGAAKLQANLVFPVQGPGGDDPRLRLNAQIAF